MKEEQVIIGGLTVVMGLILVLPFISKTIEKYLEAFFFIMGIAAVSISQLWSWQLLSAAFVSPLMISAAVLLAGFLFRAVHRKIGSWTRSMASKIGRRWFLFILVVGLGLLSSVITAIIAALILAEVITALRFSRRLEVKLTIIACFAIGLGAVLTPLGEPLSTIAAAKLRGEPHNADFFFLFKIFALWVVPAIFGLGAYASFIVDSTLQETSAVKYKRETNRHVIFRSLRVYLFVFALILVGTGFTPIADKYFVYLSTGVLYWVNIVSAVLDNATLVAIEVTPAMTIPAIKAVLLGILISGGMLVPGNIPNIICANKLPISMKDWAYFGIPLGSVLMIIFFMILVVTGCCV